MINKNEIKVLNYIQKNIHLLFAIVMVVISLILRIYFIDYLSFDLSYYNLEWFDYLKQNGGFFALKNVIDGCDYTQTYLILLSLLTYIPNVKPLYLLKIVSIIFDFVLAFFSGKIVEMHYKNNNSKTMFCLTFSIVLLLPTVLLNSSCWGQCDSIYSAFVLMSLYYLLQNKYIKSFIFLGIAFSFKLQFIFIIPLFIIYYFKEKKFSILYFLIIPATCFVMCLPSILIGHPIVDCFNAYFLQVNEYTYQMSFNIPNIYELIPNFDGLSYICFALFALMMAILLIATCNNKTSISNINIIELSLISVSFAVFLLPCMHDRYLYMADVLSIIWFLIKRKKIFVPMIINFVSLSSYCKTLFSEGLYVSNGILPILFLTVVVFLIYAYLQDMDFIDVKEK